MATRAIWSKMVENVTVTWHAVDAVESIAVDMKAICAQRADEARNITRASLRPFRKIADP